MIKSPESTHSGHENFVAPTDFVDLDILEVDPFSEEHSAEGDRYEIVIPNSNPNRRC